MPCVRTDTPASAWIQHSMALFPVSLRFVEAELEAEYMHSRSHTQHHLHENIPVVAVLGVLGATLSFSPSGNGVLYGMGVVGALTLAAIAYLSCARTSITAIPAGSVPTFGYVVEALVFIIMVVHATCPLPPVEANAPGYPAEGVINAAFVMTGCIICHVMSVPLRLKALVAFGAPAVHGISPIWVVGGAREFQLMLAASAMGTAFGYAIEKTMRRLFYEERMRARASAATIKADSRLNHVLKGLCGGASSLIEGVLASRGTPLDAESSRLIEQVRSMLGDAASWCHKRELFLQLESQVYNSVRASSSLASEVRAMLGDDGKVHGVESACVDGVVLRLAIEEALSNARKYRKPGTPITVELRLVDPATARLGMIQGVGMRGSQVALHAMVTNANRAGLPCMSPDECERVLQPATKGSVVGSPLSDGLGLDTAAKAAAAAGGRVWLTVEKTCVDQMGEPGACTVFHVALPAAPLPPAFSGRAFSAPTRTPPPPHLSEACARSCANESMASGGVGEAFNESNACGVSSPCGTGTGCFNSGTCSTGNSSADGQLECETSSPCPNPNPNPNPMAGTRHRRGVASPGWWSDGRQSASRRAAVRIGRRHRS